jgi:hypothetical protein
VHLERAVEDFLDCDAFHFADGREDALAVRGVDARHCHVA